MIGFYYCPDSNAFVVLESCPDTLTNEGRKYIVDKQQAKYRANKLKVVAIGFFDPYNIYPNHKPVNVVNIPYREHKQTIMIPCVEGTIIYGTEFNPFTMQMGIPYFTSYQRVKHECLLATGQLDGIVCKETNSITYSTFDSFGKAITRTFDIKTREEHFTLQDLLEPVVVDLEKKAKRLWRKIENQFFL